MKKVLNKYSLITTVTKEFFDADRKFAEEILKEQLNHELKMKNLVAETPIQIREMRFIGCEGEGESFETFTVFNRDQAELIEVMTFTDVEVPNIKIELQK